ncbi:MAG: ATP-binding protein, partial [Ardenticatenaceae bacterium]
MSNPEPHQIAIQPIIHYPREAEVGKSYSLTIDLRPVLENGHWPYDKEEYVLYCLVDSEPLFSNEPIGEPAVVLHRFGGSYGPAEYLLTASEEETEGAIRVTLVNGWGMPVRRLDLADIQVVQPRDEQDSELTSRLLPPLEATDDSPIHKQTNGAPKKPAAFPELLDPTDKPKYDPHFYAPVQGRVIGDRNTIRIIYSDGQSLTVPFLAPPKPPYELVGRDQLLSQLKKRLLAGANIALNGLPGVGKTALAVKLAHDPEVLAHFKDGVLWAGLGREPDVATLLDKWGMALGIPSDEMAKLTQIEDKGDKVQALISERRMLLVIDDAWDIEDAEAFRLYLPNCAHIVTTRFPEIALDFADANTQQVPELSPMDGLLLLKQLAGQVVEAEPEEANELVKAVGGLPLGLILMGRLLKKQGRNKLPHRIRMALDKLRRVEERLTLAEKPLREHHPSLPKGAAISMDAIIAISYEALNEASRRTLRALSVFLPKPNTFSEEAAEAVADKPVETLDTLEDYGLLEGRGERYALHQTIADYASLKCDGDERVLFEQRAADYFAAFAQQHSDSEGYPLLDLDWRNIVRSLEWAYEYQQWPTLMDGVQGLTRHNLGVMGFMDTRGYWREARELLGRALEGAKALNDPQLEASILSKMGAFAVRQAEFEIAEGHLQKSLAILSQLPTSEDVVLQRTHTYEFMFRLEMQRDTLAARKWVERGLAELDALPLQTREATHQKGYFYVLLATLNGRIGELEEAIVAAEQGLALLPASPTSARIIGLIVLGNVYSLQGDIQKSL